MNVSHHDFSVINSLNLEPVKFRLMHKGWAPERADAAEREYRRFLYLMKKFPNDLTAPSLEVDRFWHQHILDTVNYARDCDTVFGHFLHHYPYLGLGLSGDDSADHRRAGERMRVIYEETFGDAYEGAGGYATNRTAAERPAPSVAASSSAPAQSAFCTVAGAPAFCTAPSNAAFCTVTTAPAFATAAPKPAFCTANPSSAFCTVTAASAFCTVASEPAFCTVTSEPAFCTVTAASAFCTVTNAPNSRTVAEGSNDRASGTRRAAARRQPEPAY